MKFLIIVLTVFISVLLAVFIICYILYNKLKSKFGVAFSDVLNKSSNKVDFADSIGSTKEIIDIIKESSNDIKNTPKSVSGMTNLLEPVILKDFPDFNKELLYSKIENSLIKILGSIENNKIIEDNELYLIKDKVDEIVKENIENDILIKYDEIKFHRHAIKNYDRKDGVATITTSTSVEYYFSKLKAGVKSSEQFKEYKKQTRYTCSFVYVYDYEKLRKHLKTDLDKNLESYVRHCPNCGAPLHSDLIKCEYCGISIKNINMKSWKIASYNEDYK